MSIEPLEARIAPASVITYLDVDGDKITISSSKGELDDVLTFSVAGDVPRQLQEINLEEPEFNGTNLKITAQRAGDGDGKVNVGSIRLSAGQSYGTFVIEGDLSILGSDGAPASLAKVKVDSLGMLGASTQVGGTGDVTLQAGSLGVLQVKKHIASVVEITGDLEVLKVGGNLVGGSGAQSGSIIIGGQLTTGDVAGALEGGAGERSGSIFAGEIGSLSVGAMRGGSGSASGSIAAEGESGIGKLLVRGSVIGGESADARQVSAPFIKRLQIDGSLVGGDGIYDLVPERPGQVFSLNGYGAIAIRGDIVGGGTAFSGSVTAGEDTSLPYAGQAPVGKVTIGGSIRGGGGIFSGSLLGEGATFIRVGGSIVGGAGLDSGEIDVENGVIGPISIGGSIIGGAGTASGRLETGTENSFTGTITVGGSVLGGDGGDSGTLDVNEDGFSKVKILGSIVGGLGPGSGFVEVSTEEGGAFRVTVGGNVQGGPGEGSGGLQAEGNDVGTLVLRGSIYAGAAARSGFLDIADMVAATVRGSVFGGAGGAGFIITDDVIGTLNIAGSLVGGSGVARIIATPNPAGASISNLVIGGDVFRAEILAGYNIISDVLTPTTADAQIGSVQVGGGWFESSLVAGIEAGADGDFGTADDLVIATTNDPAIIARIGSISIGEVAQGTPGPDDNFGFVAQQIDAFRAAERTLTRNPATLDPVVTIGPTRDLFVREV